MAKKIPYTFVYERTRVLGSVIQPALAQTLLPQALLAHPVVQVVPSVPVHVSLAWRLWCRRCRLAPAARDATARYGGARR